jgi:hypothetical protein
MQEDVAQPLGVIGCLTAGFELLSRSPWLLLWPIALDLFLWLGPRLSLAPLMERYAALLRDQPVTEAEVAGQVAQFADLLEVVGVEFNLFSLLGGIPLFNVPSLLSWYAPGLASPFGEVEVWTVQGVLPLMVWLVGLPLVALVLGFMYLNGLAKRVRDVGYPDEEPDRWRGGLKFVRYLAFAGMTLAVLTLLVPLALFAIGAVAMIAPFLGQLAWFVVFGLAFYVAVHMLFVVHGILLGDRGLLSAIGESFLLARLQFPALMGLVLVITLIYEGLRLIWSLPQGDTWTLLVGVLGNACVATGLTATTFVFYRERIDLLAQLRRISETA